MKTQINTFTLNFKAIRGKEFQSFNSKQNKILQDVEIALNKPKSKYSDVTYMQELEKHNVDIYVKPGKTEDSIKASLIRYKKYNQVQRLANLGAFDSERQRFLPDLALAKQKEADDKFAPLKLLVLGATIAIGGALLTTMITKTNKKFVNNTVDTVKILKHNIDKPLQDTLKLFQ